jgi:hypothetical protein
MLLKSPHQGWRSIARRHPIFAFLIVILSPHLLAAVFNFIYNWTVIIREIARDDERAVDTFYNVATTINLTFFPAGLMLLFWLVWPVFRALAITKQSGGRIVKWVDALGNAVARVFPRLSAETSAKGLPQEMSRARVRALRLPIYAGLIGIGLWVLASLLYPLFLPAARNIHFMLSLVVCGLVVGVYPFFGTAYVVVRVFYPALLSASSADPREEKQLRRLVRETGFMLLTTVAVPLVGVFMLYVGQKWGLKNTLVDISLVFLFILGLAGIFIAFFMYQRIRDDVEALVEAARPADTQVVRSTATVSKTWG